MRKLFLLLALIVAAGCVTQTANQNGASTSQAGSGDQAFKTIHDKYVIEFLRRNPTVNTYLGGAGLDPSLREVDGQLRDHSARALAAEDRWLERMRKAFTAVNPASL